MWLACRWETLHPFQLVNSSIRLKHFLSVQGSRIRDPRRSSGKFAQPSLLFYQRIMQSVTSGSGTFSLNGVLIAHDFCWNSVDNGEILGSVDDGDAFVLQVRNCPAVKSAPLHITVSSYVGASGHVYIHTDEGRIVRPLVEPCLCFFFRQRHLS